MLKRIGISLESGLLDRFDRTVQERGYVNRSEAVRDLIRDMLVQEEWREPGPGTDEKVAVVTLVYDHESMDLAQKLTHIQHQHHGVVVSALHIHMDEHNCLEVLVLRGDAETVLKIGDQLVSTRGVRHGKVVAATTGRELH